MTTSYRDDVQLIACLITNPLFQYNNNNIYDYWLEWFFKRNVFYCLILIRFSESQHGVYTYNPISDKNQFMPSEFTKFNEKIS
jgi:hypothetical protein